MHTTTRSTPSISAVCPGDVLDLSLTGSQLSVSKRPSSASPGKFFSRSVSVSVATESKGKRNKLNLRRSNKWMVAVVVMLEAKTHRPTASGGGREEPSDDFLGVFDGTSDGRRKLASLSKASTDRTTWNILDDQPRVFPLASSARSTGSVDSQTQGMKRRDHGLTLAANFTANNRSNKGAVGNSVTTMLHNNYSEKPLTPKSSNQKPAFNNILKATEDDEASLEHGSVTKSQKNFASAASPTFNHRPLPRREVTEEEAERFIQQVNQAAVTIQRWYRHHTQRTRSSQAVLRRLLATKKEEWEQRVERDKSPEELQQKRAEQAAEAQQLVDQELEAFRRSGRAGRKKPAKTLLANNSPASPGKNGPASPADVKARNTDSNANVVADFCEVTSFRAVSPALSNRRGSQCSQEILQRSVSMEDQRPGPASSSRALSKTTLNDLLDTLKLLEEDPEKLSEPSKGYHRDKYAWIDEDGDSTSLTTDNLERHGQLTHNPALPDGGALLSEAKLQSIMSFLDEMEKSEQERPRSVASRSIASGSHREVGLSEEELAGVEQASATAAEVRGSMMRLKLDLDEKRRTVNMLQAALAQQRELTVRHVEETEKELNQDFQLQREQYEATIQRHLAFMDQLIDDKKALSERCGGVVAELKQVDQKYTKKIGQMQAQHDMVWQILGPLCEEIRKLKELMSATEKVRREKWIDEKTKKIKEITVKGLEPEIQKLISKHKQELKRLRAAHEAELQGSDQRAAQRYVLQCQELREQLGREKDQQCQREKDAAKQRYEKQLQEEEMSLQQQRRRLYTEVSDEKERLTQLAARQRAELEDLRRRLEDNSSLAGHALPEELDRTPVSDTGEQAIQRLEEETSAARQECERAAENRVKRVRDKYELELRELEHSERASVEKQQQLRKLQTETEGELIRVQGLLRQREREMEDVVQSRDKMAEERHSLAQVIRQEFAERLVETEEENRRMRAEVSEARARLRLEVERVTGEKEAELAEVHQRVKSAILKKEETVSSLRKQHEAALKRAEHLEALWEQQRKQLLEK
ncbi:hypothetical protein NHX12_024908 [Muraenolepis orangiensis]|uniref:Centrosomal protein of 131 kDa n=1 Tax=Muraenolepis orangiensis TaxID=630683 RepID=A0A9Q0IP67_9TELE|nr:hypothetical protein NHX12_024908 [Muraenolepis orangiensis]